MNGEDVKSYEEGYEKVEEEGYEKGYKEGFEKGYGEPLVEEEWSITRKENAVSGANGEYAGEVLWRLDVTEEHIRKKGKKFCSVAWDWLFSESNCPPPEVFDKCRPQVQFLHDKYHLPYSRTQFDKDFNSYWRETPWCQLWDVLFMDCVAEGCLQIVLQHPIDGTWEKEKY